MKTKGRSAAAWFAGQSFHGRCEVQAPVAPMVTEMLEMDELLAQAQVGCAVCASFGRNCCKLHQGAR